MYKIFFLLIAGLFIMTSCSSPDAALRPDSAVDVSIIYVNKKGENLLNSDHPHAITEENTNLYYLINGKKEKGSKVGLVPGKQFSIEDTSGVGGYRMIITPNTLNGRGTAITYIVFKDYPTDTLKVQYEHHHGPGLRGFEVTKYWYNGKLKWEASQHRSRWQPITVIKHRSEK